MDQSENGQRLGEVVESASHGFTAHCYRLYDSPPLGSLVRTESTDGDASSTYAVVYSVVTQSLDPGRPVVARGESEDTEQGIYQSHPQLERLLATRFEALIVGHGNGSDVNQYLPALPPRIHAFVFSATSDEVASFIGSLDFLNLLVHLSPAGRGTTDEVIAACLRRACNHVADSRGFLVRAGKVLAVQLAGDMPRLNAILRRLSP